MPETSRALGLSGSVEWRGRPLTVCRVTLGIEARFEDWLAGEARAVAVRGTEVLGDASALEAWGRGLEGGEFCWSGDLARRTAWTPRGFTELSYWCLHRHHPDWTRRQHAELTADPVALAGLAREVRRVSDPWPGWLARPGVQGGATLTTTEFFATLAGEPCDLRPDEIADLDRWQALALYFPRRDRDGRVTATGVGSSTPTERERFTAWWRARCLPEWQADELWGRLESERARRARDAREQLKARQQRAGHRRRRR